MAHPCLKLNAYTIPAYAKFSASLINIKNSTKSHRQWSAVQNGCKNSWKILKNPPCILLYITVWPATHSALTGY